MAASRIPTSIPPAEFEIQVLSTPEEIKLARETISQWKDLIGERLGQSRLAKDTSPEKLSAFFEDKTTFDKYREVTSYLSDAITQAQTELRSGASKKTFIFIARHPSTQAIQGMSASSLEVNRVYLKSLISAPWNISMHALLPVEQRSLVVRGTRKTLLAKTYALAQRTGRPQLETTPLASAFTFYKSVGMSFDQENCTFKFDVSEKIPPLLSGY